MHREDINLLNLTVKTMLKKEVALHLFDLVTPMEVKRIVDVGTGFGMSSKFFSDLKPQATIYTVDGFGLYGDGRIYKEYSPAEVKKIIFSHPHNVIQILGDSQKVPWELPIDVLFIDADHTYEGCKADYDNYSPFLVQGGLLIFDDYIQENNPTNGVRKVVDELTGYDILYTGISAIMRKK
jgi:predicted O-methyltransferase YrrM